MLSASSAQTPASSAAINVSTVKVGAPSIVTELDLGKLKGELRQIAWSPNRTELYVQTAEGTPPSGTGSGRPGEGAGGVGNGAPVDIEKTAEGQRQNVVRLTLVGEAISEFVNTRPVPGLTFSWGPAFSGAIAYTDRDGRLMLLDRNKHKQTVSGAKDALLPAWSIDGARLAWVQKSGRKKYTLLWATVTKG